jgi:hypothetical protein
MDQLIEKLRVTIYLATHTGKNRTLGTRGHSSLAGWRDTLFRLDRKKNVVEVKIDPRWGAPFEFNLEFKDGTLWPTEKSFFAPTAARIRSFLQNQNGRATKTEIAEHLNLKGDALRKALERAERDKAITVIGDLVSLPELVKPDVMDQLFN